MRYMLDTDISSYIIREHDPRLLATLQTRARSGAEISISVVTYAELRLGAERAQDTEKHNELIRAFCTRLHTIVAWSKTTADEYARLQAGLLRSGKPIGRNDAMIAAHAIELEYILVTNNQRHFSKLPNLQLENWLR